MKYRGKLSNAFQLDFMAKQIHINMPRRSRFLFSCLANGCSKGTGRETSRNSYFQDTYAVKFEMKFVDIHEVVQTGSDSTLRVVLSVAALALRFWIKLFVLTLFASSSVIIAPYTSASNEQTMPDTLLQRQSSSSITPHQRVLAGLVACPVFEMQSLPNEDLRNSKMSCCCRFIRVVRKLRSSSRKFAMH